MSATRVMKTLDEPKGMRPADRRPAFSGWNVIGEYDLSNGRTVRVIWLATTQTDCHIIVWDDDTLVRVVENINRLQAPRLTEEILVEIEQS
jgi:hypothetical protein